MISGIDLQATVDFTVSTDKKDPTIWKLGVLPSYLFAQISTSAKDNQTDAIYNIVRVGLKGWENFKVGNNDVVFETEKAQLFGRELDAVKMDVLNQIPFSAVMELATKIMDINQLSGGEKKN